MSWRQGPVPPGRRMFAVSAEETIAPAQEGEFRLLLKREARSALGAADVSWTRLAFARPIVPAVMDGSRGATI